MKYLVVHVIQINIIINLERLDGGYPEQADGTQHQRRRAR